MTALLTGALSSKTRADSDQDEAKKLVESGQIVPLESILDKVRKRYGGRILEVKLEHNKNRMIYEIEMVSEKGVVNELVLDASNGTLIKEQVED
jgi:uncharacterized membrane protein YkoI